MILQGERQTLAIVLRVQSGQRLGVETQPEMTSFLHQGHSGKGSETWSELDKSGRMRKGRQEQNGETLRAAESPDHGSPCG